MAKLSNEELEKLPANVREELRKKQSLTFLGLAVLALSVLALLVALVAIALKQPWGGTLFFVALAVGVVSFFFTGHFGGAENELTLSIKQQTAKANNETYLDETQIKKFADELSKQIFKLTHGYGYYTWEKVFCPQCGEEMQVETDKYTYLGVFNKLAPEEGVFIENTITHEIRQSYIVTTKPVESPAVRFFCSKDDFSVFVATNVYEDTLGETHSESKFYLEYGNLCKESYDNLKHALEENGSMYTPRSCFLPFVSNKRK